MKAMSHNSGGGRDSLAAAHSTEDSCRGDSDCCSGGDEGGDDGDNNMGDAVVT
jgi:hypothetical protein